jgi:hypothetical protein
MKAWKMFVLVTVVAAASVALVAQDAVKVDPTHYKVLIDNTTVRVLRIAYAPGSKSVMHQHPDSIVIPLVASKVRFTLPDGTSQDSDMANESAQYTPAGRHNPMNTGSTAVEAVLVEFKNPAGLGTLPTSRPGMTLKTLAEGSRAAAYRATMATSFAEPAGTTHDFDQVVIALAPAQLSLALPGKPAKTSWARGDVEFIARFLPHEAKNTGGKPVDIIVVAIK